LELGSRAVPIAAGDTIHIEGQHYWLRRREIGVEITRAPDLANDGTHGLETVTNEVNLTAGYHPFQLEYFNHMGAFGLELTVRLPDGSVYGADRAFVRTNGGAALASNRIGGLEATYYEGSWLNLPDFALLQPIKTMATTNLDPTFGPARELFGIRLNGLFSAPMDGKYTFNLASDDGSLLFLDGVEVALTMTGHEDVPVPIVSSLHLPIADSEAPRWISVEGRVAFVSRSGRGLRFELRSPPDSIWVMVADSGELDPQRLLNSRIRITGVGRAVMAPNRDRMLGELLVATADNITILQDSEAVTSDPGSTPTLRAVGQIQSLSKEEAARHLPVRIRGVVTSLSPSVSHFMSVQDETRGIFVRLPSSS